MANDVSSVESVRVRSPFEQIAPLSTEQLKAKIAAFPTLAAEIAAYPDFLRSLLAATDLAEAAVEFQKVFADPDEARIAAEGNAEFSLLSDLLFSGDGPEGAECFYRRLMDLSVIFDENGKPMLDQAGKPISDGTVGRFIEDTGELFLNYFDRHAETTGDALLAAAVATLRAAAFSQRWALGLKDADDEKLARIATWKQSIEDGIDAAALSEIDSLLSQTNVADSERSQLAAELRKELYKRVVANPQFQREQDILMRHNWGDKTRKARIDLGRKWIVRVLPLIAPAFLKAKGEAPLEGADDELGARPEGRE